VGKAENKSRTVKVTVSLSEQVADLLDQIAATGLMGQSGAQVAHRFIDEAAMKALDNPHLELKQKKTKKRT
jgi:hypothetical protein